LGFVCWGLLACGGDDTGPSSEYVIEGRVLDQTGHGVSGAKVHFESDALDSADTDSDDDGSYHFDVRVREGVEFGILTATHDGYTSPAARTVYFDGTLHVINVSLRKTNASK
jgi:hypothetical protein